MANGFKINRQAIRKVSREIEREFAKHPVRVPLEADDRTVSLPRATTVNNYHGPVVTVTGDHAQVAWGNRNTHQAQDRTEQVAPGYEHLAALVTDLLASAAAFSLDDADQADLRTNAEGILEEVVKPDPDPRVARRGVMMIKGLLAPVAAGVSKAVTDDTAETAREVIDALGSALS